MMKNQADFVIRKSWERPASEKLEVFKSTPTALIADALGQGFGVMHHQIHRLWRCPAIVGPALPIETAPHDILAVHAACAYAQPGDVAVIATKRCEAAAVVGGMTVSLLRNAGVIGVVTDGVARDAEELEQAGFPVYAAGVSPGIPFKHGPGRIGVHVSLGDVAVGPGDIIAADQDGVVVVPVHQIDRVLAALTRAASVEADLGQLVRNVRPTLPYVEAALQTMHTIYVE